MIKEKKLARRFSRVTILFYIPIYNVWVIQFCHILIGIWCHPYIYIFFFNFSHSHSDKCVISHCGFNLIFLMASDVKNRFIGLSATCIPLLVKSIFIYFSHFLIKLFAFILLSLESYLYILKTSCFVKIWFANTFSNLQFLFSLLMESFKEQTF